MIIQPKCIQFCPAASSTGLYFTLNDVVYLPGDTVLITHIGIGVVADSDTGSSLVCNTTNANTHCCRGADGGNVGEWFFPDGSMVPRNRDGPNGNFIRTGWTHQVRLSRRNNAMTPLGPYECRVPHMDTTSTEVYAATIIISGEHLLMTVVDLGVGISGTCPPPPFFWCGHL